MITRIRSFMKNASGATAVEYGLIAALIAMALIAAIKSTGGKSNTTYTTLHKKMK
jgi:pilus assembly protein Flp/PilA